MPPWICGFIIIILVVGLVNGLYAKTASMKLINIKPLDYVAVPYYDYEVW